MITDERGCAAAKPVAPVLATVISSIDKGEQLRSNESAPLEPRPVVAQLTIFPMTMSAHHA